MSAFRLRSLGGCKPKPARERFFASFVPDPNSGCWLWLGRERGSNAYGGIKVNGRYLVAHRFSWELHNGEIPVGLIVCHRCDNSACVNPAHLFIGTHKDNEIDKLAKGRRGDVGTKTPLRGEANCKAKLTDAKVLAIREDARPQRVIAKEYGTTQSAIWKVKTRRTWRHV